jgi:ABC-2 type transport system permease protein
MTRTARLLARFLANSVQLDLEYRSGFMIGMINTLLSLGAGAAVLLALLQYGGEIGGWDTSSVIVLLGVFTCADAMVGLVFRPSLRKVAEYIELGNMDYMLLKPVNLQFNMSFRAWSFWQLPNFVIGLALMVGGMSGAGTLIPEHVAMALLGLTAGITILYALWATVTVMAFWFVRINNAQMILYALMGVARYPATIYPTGLRLFFTFVLPVTFITNVPAAAAVAKVGWTTIGLSWLVAAITLLLSRSIWRHAIRHYTSASS